MNTSCIRQIREELEGVCVAERVPNIRIREVNSRVVNTYGRRVKRR